MKPQALEKGDTIGVVSPSWCGPALFPHRVERGRAFLESLGYRVVLAEHAVGRRGWVSGTPEERAADIHRMFADPDVKAIVAAIGGDHSCQVLPHLDFGLIAANPKVFVGFSDVTVLNLAIHAHTGPIGEIAPASVWTDERLDWGTKADLTRARTLKTSPGWAWLRPGRGEGPLVGGCLESMEQSTRAA